MRTRRPDLIILTDDVYGTFVPGFTRSPRTSRAIPSWSTPTQALRLHGLALGGGGPAGQRRIDEMLARRSPGQRARLRKRYATISGADNIKFIDRLVADSRDVALNRGALLPRCR